MMVLATLFFFPQKGT